MKSIDQLFAFTQVDPKDGVEGIISVTLPHGLVMPLVGADMERVHSLKPYAEDAARMMGREVTLKRFSRCETLQVFVGAGPGGVL